MKRSKPLRRVKHPPFSKRSALRRRNEERLAERRAQQFGEQAEWCRTQPCVACQAPAPSDAHHALSRGAGGKDEHTVPLCRRCHDEVHAKGELDRLRGADLKDYASHIHTQKPWKSGQGEGSRFGVCSMEED